MRSAAKKHNFAYVQELPIGDEGRRFCPLCRDSQEQVWLSIPIKLRLFKSLMIIRIDTMMSSTRSGIENEANFCSRDDESA